MKTELRKALLSLTFALFWGLVTFVACGVIAFLLGCARPQIPPPPQRGAPSIEQRVERMKRDCVRRVEGGDILLVGAEK